MEVRMVPLFYLNIPLASHIFQSEVQNRKSEILKWSQSRPIHEISLLCHTVGGQRLRYSSSFDLDSGSSFGQSLYSLAPSLTWTANTKQVG